MDGVRAHERRSTGYALERLRALDGLTCSAPRAPRSAAAWSPSTLDGRPPHDIGELLGRRNVCVRASHHCAQPLMARLGVAATARASFGPYNVAEDIDELVDAIGEAQEVFGV